VHRFTKSERGARERAKGGSAMEREGRESRSQPQEAQGEDREARGAGHVASQGEGKDDGLNVLSLSNTPTELSVVAVQLLC